MQQNSFGKNKSCLKWLPFYRRKEISLGLDTKKKYSSTAHVTHKLCHTYSTCHTDFIQCVVPVHASNLNGIQTKGTFHPLHLICTLEDRRENLQHCNTLRMTTATMGCGC